MTPSHLVDPNPRIDRAVWNSGVEHAFLRTSSLQNASSRPFSSVSGLAAQPAQQTAYPISLGVSNRPIYPVFTPPSAIEPDRRIPGHSFPENRLKTVPFESGTFIFVYVDDSDAGCVFGTHIASGMT